jgi:hypothetical protein
VIQQHIAAMEYGHINVGISSWWGQGTPSDSRFAAILAATAGRAFRWSIYYEPEGQGNPSVQQITADLTYLRDHYGHDPSYFRIGGRFVVFVYAGQDDCEMADRWTQANTVNAYIVLKVFPDYRKCASQPDGWHQYAPALAAEAESRFSYTISPGFWKASENERLPRDLARWQQNIRDMIASGAPFQLITTFNEWGEGTAIESASEWASPSGYGAFLDILHNNGEGTLIIQSVGTDTDASTSVPSASTSTESPARSTVAAPTTTLVPAPTITLVPAPTGTPVPSAQDAVLIAVGDIGSCQSTGDEAAARLVAQLPGALATLGDTVYESGTAEEFAHCFDPAWGPFKDRIHPATGNHEYLTPGASPYFNYFGAAAGDPNKGYYSYDLGTWHIVVINSTCSQAGGCKIGSPQGQWLQADLAAHPNLCTLAYWHHPRFSSGEHGNFISMQGIWQALYDHGAEIVLNGHDHDYERFAPQDPNGTPDPVSGIREFVVGTGGKNHYSFVKIQPNSEVRNSDTFGILKLILHPASYDWQFIPVAGKTFTDSGSAPCH